MTKNNRFGNIAIGAVCIASALTATAGLAQQSASDVDLAQELSNPIANLISVPFQLNYDDGYGADGDGSQWVLNIQPVIPFSLNQNWIVISRTIVPVISSDIGDFDEFSVGDIVQSFFFSPEDSTASGWTWGAGPVFLLPIGSSALSTDTFALGPTVVALKQQNGWTFGGLANHLWSVDADEGEDISNTFLQPFVSYTTADAVTFTLNSESTYNWETEEWSVPINAIVAKLTSFGQQKVSLGVGVRYWAESPDTGPDGWGLRLNATWLFPK